MPRFNFAVELHLEGLPEQELISLEFGFDNNITRSLLVYVDTRPVSVNIKQNGASKEDINRGRVRYELDVIFSSRIVSRPNEEAFSCTGVTGPLNSLIYAAQFSGGRHSLTPSHLMAVKNAADKLSTCATPQKKLHEDSCVSLNGVNASFISDDSGLDVCGFTNRRTPLTTVLTAVLSLEKGQTRNVTVKVNGDAVVSVTGMRVPESAKSFVFETRVSPFTSDPPSTSKSDSVAAMRKLGTAISGVTGAAVGLSAVVSLGTPFLSFVVPAGNKHLFCVYIV